MAADVTMGVAVVGCGVVAIMADARYQEPTQESSAVAIRVVSASSRSARDSCTTEGTAA